MEIKIKEIDISLSYQEISLIKNELKTIFNEEVHSSSEQLTYYLEQNYPNLLVFFDKISEIILDKQQK